MELAVLASLLGSVDEQKCGHVVGFRVWPADHADVTAALIRQHPIHLSVGDEFQLARGLFEHDSPGVLWGGGILSKIKFLLARFVEDHRSVVG